MDDQERNLLFSLIEGSNNKNIERKIIFWYDEKKDYEEYVENKEFIQELLNKNTEIIKYDNNSLWIRYYIETQEQNKNIIIYLPFVEKGSDQNALLDLETANKDYKFNPDRTSILMKEYNLANETRDIIKKYEKFFKDKGRRQKFKDYSIEEKNEKNIDLIITAILLNIKTLNSKTIDIDEILKSIIKSYYFDQKKYDELLKLADEGFIIELFNKTFGSKIKGYAELKKVFKSLIFTYFATSLEDINLINKYASFILKDKMSNVQVFVNSLMRDNTSRAVFEIISQEVAKEFNIDDIINKFEIKDYKYADAFENIDNKILEYIANSISIGINEYSFYKDVIFTRETLYWYKKYENEYNFERKAIEYFEKINIIEELIKTTDMETFIKVYTDYLYEVDTLYRKIYFYFDNIKNKDNYIYLKDSVENHYVNTFMSKFSIKWNEIIGNIENYNSTKFTMQYKFYDKYINKILDKSGRIIVIISDAFRYECAKELNDHLKSFASKSELTFMQGNIPSYTKLGMASLLPGKELTRVKNSDDILVDGEASSSTKDREKVLQKKVKDSLAIQYDELCNMKKGDWKKRFNGKKLVYIYHNTIDNVGEHDENKIFGACEDAINEIEELIKNLHTTFSGVNVFVTSDHGFFYKRGRIEEYEKTNKDESAFKQKTRYSYTDKKSTEEGLFSIDISYIFKNESGYVNIPKGYNIFSRQGLGINYVHGGILPQEIIIPVIDFKSSRGKEESKKVGITYSGFSTKISNEIEYLNFLQDSNIDETNLPCRYILHFEDEEGNRVSDECTIVANYKNKELKDRYFREKFVFRNIKYDKNKSYYLVIIDEDKYNSEKEKERENSVVKKLRFVIEISNNL